ncbi:MAG: 16S rRNA (cytosine(1402)-N(4))-methyltransferase RsmH [Gammaproteobacteria bacterium]
MRGAQTHRPVLRDEILEALRIRPDGCYLDATYGRGGHSEGIAASLGRDGMLIAVDRDPEAVAHARKLFADDTHIRVVQGNFGMLREIVGRCGCAEVDGIVMDLGVSSPQLDDPDRGFSFMRSGPLDMRMDPESGISAAAWLANAAEKDISDVLKRYGEERHHRRIARAIVQTRDGRGDQPPTAITTTGQLAGIVTAAVPKHEPGKHPATRTFQAIRIFINDELGALETALDDSVDILAQGGRLCVISFHSLEDRIVKRYFRDRERGDPRWAGLPQMPEEARPVLKRIGKAIRPSQAETEHNPRARSAVLRVAEKLA